MEVRATASGQPAVGGAHVGTQSVVAAQPTIDSARPDARSVVFHRLAVDDAWVGSQLVAPALDDAQFGTRSTVPHQWAVNGAPDQRSVGSIEEEASVGLQSARRRLDRVRAGHADADSTISQRSVRRGRPGIGGRHRVDGQATDAQSTDNRMSVCGQLTVG
jgi:hypothetical protein